MTAHRPLILRTQEQAAKELALHAQVEVLAGGIVHIHVHGADGNPLPRVRNWTIWTGRVVPRADRGGIRVKNGVAEIRLEVDQRVKWGIPGAVRPDIVED